MDFVNKYAGLFSFKSVGPIPAVLTRTNVTSQTYMNYLEEKAARCNYTGYVDKYVTYPPTGPLPLPGDSTEFAEGCDVWDEIYYNALIINPAFNIYHIWDTVSRRNF